MTRPSVSRSKGKNMRLYVNALYALFIESILKFFLLYTDLFCMMMLNLFEIKTKHV